MNNTAQTSIRKPNKVSGHASFLHRNSGLRARVLMFLGDKITGFFGLLLWLGGLPLQRWLVHRLGGFAHWVSPRRRHVARTNLDLVYGQSKSDAEKDRIVRAHFSHFTRGFLDFLYDNIYWPQARVATAVKPCAKAKLDEMAANGHGSAVISCHLGNPELLLRLLTEAGYNGYALYKGMKSPWFDRYVGRKRLRAGAGLIEIPSSRHSCEQGKRVKHASHSLRDELEVLWQDGAGVGFVADQHTRSGIRINVLGVPDTPTQIGAWRYLTENQIPLLLHVAVYEADGSLTWHCSEIYHTQNQGTPDETLMYYLQTANDWFESMIHAYPEQYFWAHRRFDRRHYETTA